MSLNETQASILVYKGLLPQSQVAQALAQLPTYPNHDLCSFLQERQVLSHLVAEDVRQEARESSARLRKSSYNSRFVPAVSSSEVSSSGSKLEISGIQQGTGRQQSLVLALKDILREDQWFRPHAELLWERVDKLGAGGMGIVYRVRDNCLGRDAALKLLLDESSPRVLQRFIREASITARLNHPSIPPVYEAGKVASGQHYMVMKVIEGQTLESRIADLHNNDFSEKGLRELLEALARVGEAISYAHSEKIVHRDLKPANIMIGRFGEVLVMDWGVAKDLNSENEMESVRLFDNAVSETELEKAGVTLSGAVVGTPGYMSPEQLEGECVPQSDVFSLGLILTEILTGEKAVRGNSTIERVAATASGNAVAPRSIDRSVSKELDCLVREATHVPLSDRLGSAAEFTENLQAYLAGEDLPVYSYSVFDRFSRWSSRYPGWFVGISFSILLLSISTSVYSLVTKSETARVKALDIAKEAQSSEQNLKDALKKIQELDNLVKRGVPRERIEEGIEKALELGGDSYSVLLSAAKVCRLGGLRNTEKRILNKAIDDFPPAYEALYLLHEIQLKENVKGNELRVVTKAGKRLSERAQSRGEVNEFTIVLAAVDCMRTKEYKKGLETLKNFEKYSKSFAPAYLLRAMFYIDLDDYQSALRELNTAIKYEKRDAKIYHNRGSVYSGLGEKKKAIADYSESIRLAPNSWFSYTNRARTKIELGDLEGAMADFAKAIEVHPDSTEPLLERGNARYKLEKDDDALEDYEAALAIDPECKSAYFGRGRVYLRLKQYPQAIADANKTLELDPKMASGYILRGVIHELCGRSIMALEDYSSCLKYNPKWTDALRNTARVHIARTEPIKALEAYSRLIKIEPTVEHYLLKVAVLMSQRDYAGALVECRLALKLEKTKEAAKIYYQIAGVHQILDNGPAVETNLREALKADPSYVPALFRLGYLFYLKKNFAEALQQYELVLKYDSKYALAYYGRGQVKERQRLYRAAGLDFEQFIRFAPRDPKSPGLRGLVQQYLNRSCRY